MFQSSHETNTDTAIGQFDNNKITKKPKINNIHFGDDICQDPQVQSTRIFFQDVNGLEFTTTYHTLLATCKEMQDKQIDIAYLAESNTNWNHYKGRRHLNRIVRQHWKRAHLTMSNIENKVKTIYQPG